MATLKEYVLTQLKGYDSQIAEKKYVLQESGKALISDTDLAKISSNAVAIGNLATYVGTIPSTATATDVVGYIAEAADGAVYDDTAVKADIQQNADDIDAIESSIGTVTAGKTVVGMIGEAQAAAEAHADSIVAALGTVLEFKGTVAKVSDLPTATKAGDVYHVTDKSAEYVSIDNGGSFEWEEMGSVIDLSGYAEKTQVAADIATAKSEAITAAGAEADTKISTAIGSLGAGVATVKDYVDAQVAAEAARAQAEEAKALTASDFVDIDFATEW